MEKKRETIFLIGFMGAGKSTVARELERRLGARRVEMDAAIAECEGMPISEIFEKYGESYFRDAETKLLRELASEEGIIVSCGGGAVLREENAALMKECGRIVLLQARPETIYARVKNSTERPILNGNMNVEYIRGLMEQRSGRYLAVADLIVETDEKSVSGIAEEILAAL